MSKELTIEYVGPSDEDRAHLRLLMRRLGDDVAARWRWGAETRADVLYIDPSTLPGQMARSRAQQGGVRCILIGETTGSIASNELVLSRPFRAEALAKALDAVSASRIDETPPASKPTQTLQLELEPVPEELFQDPGLLAMPSLRRARDAPTHDDAERLFRREILPKRPAQLDATRLSIDTDIAPAGGPTARSQVRGMDGTRVLGSAQSTLREVSSARIGSIFTLREYLEGTHLGGPARVVVEGLPPLALDPKEHAFHSRAPLAALMPFCRTPLRLADWVPLTTSQLRALRENEPARDYQQLLWLDRLQLAGGQLPRRFDPGGTYRLTANFEVASDFPRQQRIARALSLPMRLHEIAASTGVQMGEVFDTIAAFDSLGIIECRQRERTARPQAALPVPPPVRSNGLIARALMSISLTRSDT